MKKNLKKMVSVGLAATLILTGCTAQNQPSGSQTQETTKQAVTQETEAQKAETQETEVEKPSEADKPAEATGEAARAVRREEDTWDLTEYFADDAAFDAEIQAIYDVELPKYKEMAEAVKDAPSLLAYNQYCENLSLRLSHLGCYAQQKMNLDASDSTAVAQINDVTVLSQELSLTGVALTNRLLDMDEEFWQKVFSTDSLSPYWRELTKMREEEAHTLSEEEEELLLPSYQALGNINSVFEALNYSNIQWPVVTDPEGNKVTADYINYSQAMIHPDREYRKRFYEAYMGTIQDYRDTFAQNLNAYITLTEQLDRLHHYDSTLDAQMRAAGLTEEIYEALIEGARNNADVLRREGDIRKKALGYEKMYPYDTGMPIGNAKAPEFSYEEAKDQIRSALAPLGQDYIDTLDQAFDNRWIDVYPDENKQTGAYSGMAVDIHPWILTNFTNDFYSVSTLAHELGHAVNQYRSYEAQEGEYNKNPTALVSEVASTCNEQLLTRYMIDHAETDAEKLYYVQQELDMLYGTFFGQVIFADFEREFHRLAENGEALTADALDELYAKTKEAFSSGVEPQEVSSSYWGMVPHFYYDYYVYSYAMAVSVSSVVADAIANGDETMLKNYLEFLSAGDSADAAELFLKLGVDVTEPDYMEPLIARYRELLDLEEQLLGN